MSAVRGPKPDMTTVIGAIDASAAAGPVPPHELEAWTQEFVARRSGVGDPARRVVELARECDADLIAVTWSRSLSAGHGAVAREALERGTMPSLLVPVS